MKKNILASLLTCLFLACVFSSCNDREYADAEYPDNMVYQPMANEPVWYINEATDENPSMMTPGSTKRYILDKANNKFIVPMGVVQSGINLKSFPVDIYVDHSRINMLIFEGNVLPVGTLPLPESVYTLPASIKVEGKQATSFNLEIELSALTGANLGKKFAIAVRIDSPSVVVSEGLGTAVICIDTAFLADLI